MHPLCLDPFSHAVIRHCLPHRSGTAPKAHEASLRCVPTLSGPVWLEPCTRSAGLHASHAVIQAMHCSGAWGVQALKRLTAVQKHFADFQEDQFDFHTYCARKSTLRAYMAMLRMQDTIFAHPSYSKVPHSPGMALGFGT